MEPTSCTASFIVLNSSVLFGDEVAFKNGDRLSGLVLKSDGKNLVMRGTVAGEVTVSWQEIQELRSDQPLYVGFVDGKTLVGRVTTHDATLEVATSSGAVEASKESLAVLRNSTEQMAYQKSQQPDLLHGWDGALDAGLQLTTGNSETRELRVAFRAARRVARDNLTLYAESLYSIDELPSASPHVTASESRGGMRFDRNLSSRFFAFANTDFMSDGLQDLNLRSVLGGGAGYHLVKRDTATLDLLGGANFTRENYDSSDTLIPDYDGPRLHFVSIPVPTKKSRVTILAAIWWQPKNWRDDPL